MTKRQIKKQAKRFLDGKKINARFLIEDRCPSTDGTLVITERFPASLRLRKEIIRQANLRGWDGCHWDSPFIVSIAD